MKIKYYSNKNIKTLLKKGRIPIKISHRRAPSSATTAKQPSKIKHLLSYCWPWKTNKTNKPKKSHYQPLFERSNVASILNQVAASESEFNQSAASLRDELAHADKQARDAENIVLESTPKLQQQRLAALQACLGILEKSYLAYQLQLHELRRNGICYLPELQDAELLETEINAIQQSLHTLRQYIAVTKIDASTEIKSTLKLLTRQITNTQNNTKAHRIQAKKTLEQQQVPTLKSIKFAYRSIQHIVENNTAALQPKSIERLLSAPAGINSANNALYQELFDTLSEYKKISYAYHIETLRAKYLRKTVRNKEQAFAHQAALRMLDQYRRCSRGSTTCKPDFIEAEHYARQLAAFTEIDQWDINLLKYPHQWSAWLTRWKYRYYFTSPFLLRCNYIFSGQLFNCRYETFIAKRKYALFVKALALKGTFIPGAEAQKHNSFLHYVMRIILPNGVFNVLADSFEQRLKFDVPYTGEYLSPGLNIVTTHTYAEIEELGVTRPHLAEELNTRYCSYINDCQPIPTPSNTLPSDEITFVQRYNQRLRSYYELEWQRVHATINDWTKRRLQFTCKTKFTPTYLLNRSRNYHRATHELLTILNHPEYYHILDALNALLDRQTQQSSEKAHHFDYQTALNQLNLLVFNKIRAESYKSKRSHGWSHDDLLASLRPINKAAKHFAQSLLLNDIAKLEVGLDGKEHYELTARESVDHDKDYDRQLKASYKTIAWIAAIFIAFGQALTAAMGLILLMPALGPYLIPVFLGFSAVLVMNKILFQQDVPFVFLQLLHWWLSPMGDPTWKQLSNTRKVLAVLGLLASIFASLGLSALAFKGVIIALTAFLLVFGVTTPPGAAVVIFALAIFFASFVCFTSLYFAAILKKLASQKGFWQVTREYLHQLLVPEHWKYLSLSNKCKAVIKGTIRFSIFIVVTLAVVVSSFLYYVLTKNAIRDLEQPFAFNFTSPTTTTEQFFAAIKNGEIKVGLNLGRAALALSIIVGILDGLVEGIFGLGNISFFNFNRSQTAPRESTKKNANVVSGKNSNHQPKTVFQIKQDIVAAYRNKYAQPTGWWPKVRAHWQTVRQRTITLSGYNTEQIRGACQLFRNNMQFHTITLHNLTRGEAADKLEPAYQKFGKHIHKIETLKVLNLDGEGQQPERQTATTTALLDAIDVSKIAGDIPISNLTTLGLNHYSIEGIEAALKNLAVPEIQAHHANLLTLSLDDTSLQNLNTLTSIALTNSNKTNSLAETRLKVLKLRDIKTDTLENVNFSKDHGYKNFQVLSLHNTFLTQSTVNNLANSPFDTLILENFPDDEQVLKNQENLLKELLGKNAQNSFKHLIISQTSTSAAEMIKRVLCSNHKLECIELIGNKTSINRDMQDFISDNLQATHNIQCRVFEPVESRVVKFFRTVAKVILYSLLGINVAANATLSVTPDTDPDAPIPPEGGGGDVELRRGLSIFGLDPGVLPSQIAAATFLGSASANANTPALSNLLEAPHEHAPYSQFNTADSQAAAINKSAAKPQTAAISMEESLMKAKQDHEASCVLSRRSRPVEPYNGIAYRASKCLFFNPSQKQNSKICEFKSGKNSPQFSSLLTKI
ncbi:MAG: hypothetical protein Tsb005_12500 [Gammaproteobacteria bacterium]